MQKIIRLHQTGVPNSVDLLSVPLLSNAIQVNPLRTNIVITSMNALFSLNYTLVDTILSYETAFNIVVDNFGFELKELIGKEFFLGKVKVKGLALHPLLKCKPPISMIKDLRSFDEIFEKKEALAIEVLDTGILYKDDDVKI